MRRRTLVVVAASALLVLAGVAAVVLLRAPAPFVFRWPEGTVYTYGVTLEVDGAVAASGRPDSLSAALAFDGDLELLSYGRRSEKGDYLLGARLTRLTRIDWTLGKQPLLSEDGPALVGTELALVVAPDGTFRRLKSPADAAPLLVNLLRQLLAPLEVIVVPGEQTWTRQQTNQVGDVSVAYEVHAGRPGVLALRRRPLRYTRLAASNVVGAGGASPTGAFEIVLDRAGHLDRIAGQEKVSVAQAAGSFRQKTRIEARLLSVSRVASRSRPALRLAGMVSSGLGDVSTSPDAQRQAREKRVAGLTMEQLVSDLLIHGSAAEFPDAGRWMWRATGLLLQHPERCRDLVDLFKSPKMTDRARGRVLDLLAGTGSPQAQKVLRELLETTEARESDRYPLFLQRLSLVQAPTAETVDFLCAKVEHGDSANTLAAAHSLGSAIGRRSREQEGEVDQRSVALLHQGLASASSARDKAGWLGALGNAGLADETPLIARYAADGDATVRAAAADALRKTQTPASEKVLLELTADADPSVQDRGLRALARYELSPDHLDELREQVAGGRLVPSSYAALLTLLETNRKQPRAVLPVLQAMLAQRISDRRLQLRVRALAGRLTSR